mgnify:CR=1 FL=1
MAIEIEVCVDCVQLLANGEVFDGNGNDISAEQRARIAAQWPEHQLVLNCEDDCEGWFSWSSCEGCDGRFGGDRHPAVAFTE